MLSRTSLLSYGLFGLPLALVALPVYVFVPQLYAQRFGLSLTAIGAVLLAARLLDAFTDPAIGWWVDGSRNSAGCDRPILVALIPLAAGYIGLFHPPAFAAAYPLSWFLGTLIVTYAGFSIASIAHQSWGAALTQRAGERSRVTATREACGLAGVVIAAALPQWLGLASMSIVFIAALLIATAILLFRSPRPESVAAHRDGLSSIGEPFRNRAFRWLFCVFVVNGIAAAIPATLFMFFAKDRLQLAQYAGLFLVLYFAAAAVSMPAWVASARRFGEARTWLIGMLLSVLAFVWAFALPSGAAFAFGVICLLSGFALGADLALPPALLAAVIARAGHSGRREGAYFGAWNWATKMNLALAAGIALPLLERMGYTPGITNVEGGRALGIAYAVVPCVLKFLAAGILWRAPLRAL